MSTFKIRGEDMNQQLFKKAIFQFQGGQNKKEFWIPDKNKGQFWDKIYKKLREVLKPPIHKIPLRVEGNFGHFGKRIHPVEKKERFHIGVDLIAEKGAPIYPVAPGILYYAGWHCKNGNYIIVKHPHIRIRNKTCLYSLYMHLDGFKVKYSLWQKILRQFHSRLYQKRVGTQDVIGYLGNTGNAKNLTPHLHLQLELRPPRSKKILILNPEKIFSLCRCRTSTSLPANRQPHNKSSPFVLAFGVDGNASSVDSKISLMHLWFLHLALISMLSWWLIFFIH